MTRTSRASFPRAILKDRTESRSGMNKHTPKNGAGFHNWGSLLDEAGLEAAAEYDDFEEEEEPRGRRRALSSPSEERPMSPISTEEFEQAREFRKKVLKLEGIDLSAIARTSSAVSTSPVNRVSPISSDAETASNKSF